MTETATDPLNVAKAAESHLLVLGGPGSGKTTLALRLALHRIEMGLGRGQSVLFVSFSRAAIARLMETAKGEIKDGHRNRLTLQTFHSWFWEILRSHGYLLGSPRTMQILLPHDEKALSGGINEDNDAEWERWQGERERLFRDEGKVVFDLFAPKVSELLLRSNLLRELYGKRHPLIIIDEAQDTGPEAWRCIELLAKLTKIVCLADLDQQIFDHIKGVGPERIAQIRKVLVPTEIDLGSSNNRSPGTEIAMFANDLLLGRPRGNAYQGVIRRKYSPRANDFSTFIRSALGQLWSTIEKQTGAKPESIAFLAPYGKGVAKISAALSAGEKPIPHKVAFDEAAVLLASRFAAFLLEPKELKHLAKDVATGLELLAWGKRANGSKTALAEAEKLLQRAAFIRAGKAVNVNVVKAVSKLIQTLCDIHLAGVPTKDWTLIKKLLKESGQDDFVQVAGHLDYLVAFNRGRVISANLVRMWEETGTYVDARGALDLAILQDQILSDQEEVSGIHVMTIHKSKGKQFDGVVILRESQAIGPKKWGSTFVWRGDGGSMTRSRKILRVGITRARKHVMFLDPAFPTCPILGPFFPEQ